MTIGRTGLAALLALFAIGVTTTVSLLAAGPNPPHGTNYMLLYGMKDGLDPANPNNYVIGVTTTASVIGAVVRNFADTPKVQDFTNQLSLKYYFVNRTCSGGTRVQLTISPSGKNNDPKAGNAFGYLGDVAFGGNCAANTWVYEDMTDAAPKWDLSQFHGLTPAPSCNMTCTWAQVVTYFSNFPGHKVLQFAVADDSCSFAVAACGTAYYDHVQAGDDSLESRPDDH